MLFQLLPDNLLVSMKEKIAMLIFLSISQPCSQLVPRSKYLFSVLNALHLSYAGFENLMANQDITSRPHDITSRFLTL